MKKRLITLIMATALALLVVGCIEISGIDYIEFDTYPKTTYLIGEDLEIFEVAYKMKGKTPVETLSSDDSRVKKVGFSTDVAGTFTMRVYIEGYEDVSINFVYTVVNSMIDTLFAGGYGTEEEPYEIETAQQLSNIRFSMDSHYVLNNDIDLEGIVWDPIGESHLISCGDNCSTPVVDNAFTGSLSGENSGSDYKIMNLTSGGYVEYYGLFDVTNGATIRNLQLVDVDIYGRIVGGLAKFLNGNTILENVVVSGTIRTTSFAGGIAGWGVVTDDGSTITVNNVTNKASIISEMDSVLATMLGGLFGQSNLTLVIDGFINEGNITHLYSEKSGTIAGQIIGQLYHTGGGEIKDSGGSGVITGNAIDNIIQDDEDWKWSFYGYRYYTTASPRNEDSSIAGTVNPNLGGWYGWYQDDESLNEGILIGRYLYDGEISDGITFDGCLQRDELMQE